VSHVSINFKHSTKIVRSEEQEPLEKFLKAKSIKVRNEMAEEVCVTISFQSISH